MAFLAPGFFDMRTVPEIVLAECDAKRGAVLHTFPLLYVAGVARSKLLSWLVVVTGIALRVLRHARLQPLVVKPMAEVTLRRAFGHLLRVHLALHLFGIRVIAMREAFDPELSQARGEIDARGLRIDRRLVTDDAHLAFFVGEILRVALNAGRVSRKHRPGIVRRAKVTGSAILCFCSVLFAIVIERRDHLDDFRVNNIERRLAHRGGRCSRALRRLVEVLLCALTSPDTCSQD